MKKITVTFFALMGLLFSARAQQAKDPSAPAKRLQAELKLSDAQTTKVTAVYQQAYAEQQHNTAMKDSLKVWSQTHNKKALFAAVIKQMDALSRKIEPILTPEQKNNYEAMLQQSKANLIKMSTN